jgi:hypothetical protein
VTRFWWTGAHSMPLCRHAVICARWALDNGLVLRPWCLKHPTLSRATLHETWRKNAECFLRKPKKLALGDRNCNLSPVGNKQTGNHVGKPLSTARHEQPRGRTRGYRVRVYLCCSPPDVLRAPLLHTRAAALISGHAYRCVLVVMVR